MNIRNQSVQYHLAALNTLKILINTLRTLENVSDFDNAMVINDDLAYILNMGKNIYKKFITQRNYEKESLELYILFLRNSMVY